MSINREKFGIRYKNFFFFFFRSITYENVEVLVDKSTSLIFMFLTARGRVTNMVLDKF